MRHARVVAVSVSVAVAVALGGLGGCATSPTPTPSPRAAAPAQAAEVSLEREQRRLAERHRGSPIVVVLDDEGALWVEVPTARAFDTGQTAIKPMLEPVLTDVAASLRRVPGARLRVSAPSDEGASPVQADRRATQVRAQLVRQGVPTGAITTAPTRRPGWLQLQIEAALRPPAAVRPAP